MAGPSRRGRIHLTEEPRLFREMNAATERQHMTPLRATLSKWSCRSSGYAAVWLHTLTTCNSTTLVSCR